MHPLAVRDASYPDPSHVTSAMVASASSGIPTSRGVLRDRTTSLGELEDAGIRVLIRVLIGVLIGVCSLEVRGI